jgi:hypothetical protein
MATVLKKDFSAFMFTQDSDVTLLDSGDTFLAVANVPYTTSQSGFSAVGTVMLMHNGRRTGHDLLQCFSVDEIRALV